MRVDLEALPHLSDLFDRLRSGRHLCADDGPLYLALRAEHAAYDAVFSALGFELVQHERGFYYFQADADLGKEATQLAVFFFAFVQAWADAGLDIESTAFRPAGFVVSDLPHFGRDSWRACMIQSGTDGPEDLVELVRRLDRYGFAERIGDDRFRFRTPAWRFLDLCRDVWDRYGEPADAAPTDPEMAT